MISRCLKQLKVPNWSIDRIPNSSFRLLEFPLLDVWYTETSYKIIKDIQSFNT